jgi:4-hydroxybenzoate polyprenyltransferase
LEGDDQVNLATRLKHIFWSSRPISWVNTAFPYAATYIYVERTIDLTLVIGTIFFLIPYNMLMYGVNDVFDYESDLRNPRKGGIEGSVLPKSVHRTVIWAAIFSCLPFVVYLMFVGNLQSGFWLALVLFTVVAYSAKNLRFKEKPVLDSLTSASHFAGPMVFALVLTNVNLADSKVVAILAAFMLWGMASHAFGAVQDIKADREGGIASIATYFGARTITRAALVMYLAAGIYLLTLSWPANLVAVAAIPYIAILTPHLNITDETCESANKGWKQFIYLNFFSGMVVTLVVNYIATTTG